MRERTGGVAPPRDVDVISAVMYPSVYADFARFCNEFGDVSVIPTHHFVTPLRPGEETAFEIEPGKTLFVRLKSVGPLADDGHRDVAWELNGESRTVRVADRSAGVKVKSRAKADRANAAHVAAPMPGAVVDVRVVPGKAVVAGQALAVLSAMKMETVVAAPRAGTLKAVHVAVGDTVEGGDLVVEFA